MSATLSELAAELRVKLSSVRRHVIRHKIPRWRSAHVPGRAWSLTDSHANAVRAHFADVAQRAELHDWLTVGQIARLFGIHRASVHRRMRQGRLPARSRRAVGPGSSGNLLYHPDDVRRAMSARPVAPLGIPRGRVSSPDLGRLLGLSESTIRKWNRDGCPSAGQTQRGRKYYDLPTVLSWLEQRPLPAVMSNHAHTVLARALSILRAHCAAERAA